MGTFAIVAIVSAIPLSQTSHASGRKEFVKMVNVIPASVYKPFPAAADNSVAARYIEPSGRGIHAMSIDSPLKSHARPNAAIPNATSASSEETRLPHHA